MSDLPPFIAGFWSDISFANENSVIALLSEIAHLVNITLPKPVSHSFFVSDLEGVWQSFELTDFIIVTWKDAAYSDSDKVSSTATSVLIYALTCICPCPSHMYMHNIINVVTCIYVSSQLEKMKNTLVLYQIMDVNSEHMHLHKAFNN